ncbi:MAG: ACP S-malonyltransferase [Gammaproteobacteria bacterium]|nr:ACP S-malonyltransferase [Gammaproteobacteria bacterium]
MERDCWKLAFIFPGQGSQSVGMLGELAADFPLVQQTFVEASDALDYDLWALVQEGPKEALDSTDKTQPAMLAAGVAVWRVWLAEGGVRADVMAGHSLGEYSALVCAGAIELADAIALVAQRGHFMQAAVPAGEGAMAAILGLDDAAVAAVCVAAAGGDVLQPVNFNSPGQVVIAGSAAAVERALDSAKTAGAKRALKLPVSVPSHCDLMKPAAEQLSAQLRDVKITSPTVPVVNNVEAALNSDPEAIREALIQQLYRPVRWVDVIRVMASHGVERVVECGPGKVLAGLNRRIERSMVAQPVFDRASLVKALGNA